MKKYREIQLTSYEDLLGIYHETDNVIQVKLSDLHSFEKHPFKVSDDKLMEETRESIEKYGILHPLLVRSRPQGGYEILSGHRRRRAAELAGLKQVPVIVKHSTEKYLIPMSDVHNDEVKDLLDKHHIQHTEAVMYRTVSNDFTPEEDFDYDMLIFFSPAGIQSLMKNFPKFEQKDIAIGSFGPTTAKAVKDAGLRLDLEAPTVAAPSMPAALDMFIREHNK